VKDERLLGLPLSFVWRPDHRQSRSLTDLANDPQLGANGLGTLAHDTQPHALRRNMIWVKALTIVADDALYFHRWPFPLL
jgi:hypothetical protein